MKMVQQKKLKSTNYGLFKVIIYRVLVISTLHLKPILHSSLFIIHSSFFIIHYSLLKVVTFFDLSTYLTNAEIITI